MTGRKHYRHFLSPLGQLLLVSDGEALTGLYLSAPKGTDAPCDTGDQDESPLREASAQLQAYFAGELRVFDLPLRMTGTPFQRLVWDELLRIPYGTTISYGELARRIGRPSASRAVGAANGQNPIALIVPCHRVIGSNGTLTGYGGGLDRKEWLLQHETVVVAKQNPRELTLASP
jgi:methylated-DNA-[protein]-cysteine S-methyltransferase